MKGKAILTVGVVIIDESKRILLVRHTKAADHLTDTYGLPAGRVQKGEGIVTACLREVKEESGLQIFRKDLFRLPSTYYAEIDRKNGKKMFVFIPFYTIKFNGRIISSKKNEPQWVDNKDFTSLNLLPNVKEIIEEVLEIKK